MTEQQASGEQTSSDEQSQADSQHGSHSEQQQVSEQTSEPKEVKDLPSWAQREIRKARSDAEKARKRAEELENSGKSDDDKRNDELKRYAERANQAEQRLRLSNAKSEVTSLAAKANAISHNAVFALIRDEIEYDDEGNPTNVAELVEKAREDEPQLFRAAHGSGDGAIGTNATSQSRPSDLFRQLARQSRS